MADAAAPSNNCDKPAPLHAAASFIGSLAGDALAAEDAACEAERCAARAERASEAATAAAGRAYDAMWAEAEAAAENDVGDPVYHLKRKVMYARNEIANAVAQTLAYARSADAAYRRAQEAMLRIHYSAPAARGELIRETDAAVVAGAMVGCEPKSTSALVMPPALATDIDWYEGNSASATAAAATAADRARRARTAAYDALDRGHVQA